MQNEKTSIVSKVKAISKDIKDVSGFGEGLCDAIAMGLYDKGYQKQHWISVDDRLPEKDGHYLCINPPIVKNVPPSIRILFFAKDLYELDAYDFYNKDGKSGFCNYDNEWGWCEYEDITHWMPLPELPKGE